jgi:hypothetical protein
VSAISLVVSVLESEVCWACGQTPHAMTIADVITAVEAQHLVVRATNTTI